MAPHTTVHQSELKPGDCLLYSPKGFFGWVIAVKTWHPIAHVEVYWGPRSWASRDGLGVDLYPWRDTQLAYVLRPRVSFDAACARRWAERQVGRRYGWLELANFVLPWDVSVGGMFCSQFATEFYRAGGLKLFPTDKADHVAPFQFLDLVGEAFDVIYQKEK